MTVMQLIEELEQYNPEDIVIDFTGDEIQIVEQEASDRVKVM